MAKILSIELGHSVIKLCEMDYKVKNPKIYQCQEAITPVGAVNDGYISEAKMKDLAYAIKETIARNGIKTKKVVFTVASAKIINREVTIPDVKESQISSVVQANLNDYFPVSLADYEVTQSLVQTIPDGPDKGKHRVTIFAAEKSMLESYKKLAAACELDIVNVCCSGATIIESARRQAAKGCQAIIKIEEKYSIISVVKDGVLMLQRSINYGVGDAMTTVATQPTFAAGDTLGVWRLITRQNCTAEQVPNVKEAGRPEAREAVSASLTTLINGILRVFDYYASHFTGDEIENVSIVGLGAQFIGVPEILGAALGIVCRKAGMFQDIEAVDSDVKQKSDAYSSCIGAGLANDGFLHEEQKVKLSKEINYNLVSILVGLLAVILVGAMIVASVIPYNKEKTKEAKLNKEKAEYEQGLIAYNEYMSAKKLYDEVAIGYSMSKHPNDNLVKFLEELQEKMPHDVVIQQFASDDTQCVIVFDVANKDNAAKTVNTIRDFESVMLVTVDSIEEEEKELPKEARQAKSVGDEPEELSMVETVTVVTMNCYYYPVTADSYSIQTTEAVAEEATESAK